MPGESVEVHVTPNSVPNVAAVAFAIVTVINPDDWNAFVPIVVTELGIVTDVKLEQPWNAAIPILVTEFPIVTDIKLVQPKNVY